MTKVDLPRIVRTVWTAFAFKSEQTMSEQPWYVEFFGEDYLRLYAPVLTPWRTAQETAYIAERLGLPGVSAGRRRLRCFRG
ncbi:MAG: hypothetical protein CVU38_04620 [Chloroflexi bacterium HGW-Chloroflexi-1]|nr:MAG: hypothetical protein CVU38_04620 [Chloroflexi bacterium HGW-Chloroflexi-1]